MQMREEKAIDLQPLAIDAKSYWMDYFTPSQSHLKK